ncbi:hypothetical protein PSEUDO9AZ_40749 [Pseudomonas sp. 9AZ]|nr:hypothetical protein PSEUDO9AZ_40749 [Pseudomonas sp. 9AZ]
MLSKRQLNRVEQGLRWAGLLEQNEALAHGFRDVPHAEGVGGQQQGVASLDLHGLAAIRGEGAAPSDKVAKLLLGDLPAPAPGCAFPNTGGDAVRMLDSLAAGDRHGLAERHGHRRGIAQGQVGGVLEVFDAHETLR